MLTKYMGEDAEGQQELNTGGGVIHSSKINKTPLLGRFNSPCFLNISGVVFHNTQDNASLSPIRSHPC